MKDLPLAAFESVIFGANIRGRIEPASTWVTAGRGRAGDLVLGRVEPNSCTELTILDSGRKAHKLTASRDVVAVLGSRDSSTHVCATFPTEGLMLGAGTHLHWVAGESGIVGLLEREPAPSEVHRPESAVPFRCTGLLTDVGGVLSIRRFAVQPRIGRFGVPIVMVAATSSEAGKTVLVGELIRRLALLGHRVGAIKVTGTGGVRDSMHHAACGAAVTLDQVDAGLITTHGDASEVLTRIPKLFQYIQEQDIDIILAELGGDLVSANNPTLFQLHELIRQTRLMLVIANDALSAAGVVSVNEARLHFPAERVRFLSSPFRNHSGMSRRMAAVGIHPVFDPRSPEDLDRLARELAGFVDTSCSHALSSGREMQV